MGEVAVGDCGIGNWKVLIPSYVYTHTLLENYWSLNHRITEKSLCYRDMEGVPEPFLSETSSGKQECGKLLMIPCITVIQNCSCRSSQNYLWHVYTQCAATHDTVDYYCNDLFELLNNLINMVKLELSNLW